MASGSLRRNVGGSGQRGNGNTDEESPHSAIVMHLICHSEQLARTN